VKTLEELTAELEETESKLRAAAEEGSEVTAEEFDALVEQRSALMAEVEKAKERARVLDEIRTQAQNPKAVRPAYTPPEVMRRVDAFDGDVLRADTGELRERSKAVLGDDHLAGHLTDQARSRLDRMVRSGDRRLWQWTIATSTEQYRSAFFKMIAGRQWALTSDEARALEIVEELRASLSTSDANGGYAIPELLDPAVILTNDGSVNPIRRVARVETGMADKWEGITSAGVTARWLGEAVEATDGSPTLSRPTVTAHKANATVTFSIEIGGGLGAGAGDWPALATEVGRMFADAKDRLETTAFVTGNGSGQPTGILTALTTNQDVKVTTSGQLSAADLRKVIKALPPRFRQNAAWQMSYGTATDVVAVGDDALANQTVNLTADPFSFPLLAKPAYENSGFSDFVAGSTAAQDILCVGDWQQYLVYDRLGSVVELIPHKFSTGNNMPTGERMLYLVWRTGADALVDGAFRVLTNT